MNTTIKQRFISISFWSLATALFCLPIIIGYLKKNNHPTNLSFTIQESIQQHESKEDSKKSKISIEIHVSGAVQYPGVYTVPIGSTVHDLIHHIDLASTADLSRINLAKRLRHGQKLMVKHKISLNVININQANYKQLITLPGIGPATAKKILAYRTNNTSFSSYNDLLKINGLTQKKIQKLIGLIEF